MSGPALPSAGPVIWQIGASLDLDWPGLEPDCPGRPTNKHSTAQHNLAQGRSRQLTTDNSNRDPFLLPWISPRLDISIINSPVHSPAHPPPTLASLVTKGQIKPIQYIPSPSPQPYPYLCSTLSAAACYHRCCFLISLLVHRCCVGAPPSPALHCLLCCRPAWCHGAFRPRSIDGTPGSLAVLCHPTPTQHRPRRAQRELRLGKQISQ